MSAAPGTEFPNPCPVCGADDEHGAWRATIQGSPGTLCPHPAERGHGTGCCCSGLSKPLFAYSGLLSGTPPLPSISPLLDKETVRQLLREAVTVVKPGEVLLLRAPDWMTPNQMREVHDVARWWLEDNAPDIKVMTIPPMEIAIIPPGSEPPPGATDEPAVS